MTGLQDIPYRIPSEWDSKWFLELIRDVLQLAEVRNAVGVGITISGEPSVVGTLTNDLMSTPFIVLSAQANLTSERVLAIEPTVLTLTDNGAGLTLEIGVATNGIEFAKIQQVTGDRILGRLTDLGNIQELTGSQATTLLDNAGAATRGLVLEAANVADLNQVISSPPTQAEVQAISDKVDEILAEIQAAGQMA